MFQGDRLILTKNVDYQTPPKKAPIIFSIKKVIFI
jgi:hypothetical protein